MYGSDYDSLRAVYFTENHCVILKEGAENINDFELMHELLHAYQRNYYYDESTEEFKFDVEVEDEYTKELIIKSICEGHANWISAHVLKKDKVTEQRIADIQKLWYSRAFDKAIEEFKQDDGKGKRLWTLRIMPHLIGYMYFHRLSEPKSLKIPLKKSPP